MNANPPVLVLKRIINNRLSEAALLNDCSEVKCGTQPDSHLLSFNAHDNPVTSVLF